MRFLTLLIAIFPFTLFAQPTITSDIIGEIGSTFGQIVAEEEVDPGPAGPNVTWDFSSLTPNDTILPVTLEYVDAVSTPFAGEFPSANIATTIIGVEDEIYFYYNLTNQIFENLGTAVTTDSGDVFIKYTNPETLLEFPFTFGTDFSDTYAGDIEVLFLSTGFAGSLTTEGDAWGTLLLPNGTFSNVLRIKSTQTRVDSIEFLGTLTKSVSNITNYLWYSGDEVSNLASYSKTTGYSLTSLGGVPIGDTIFTDEPANISYNQLLISAVNSTEEDVFKMKVFPNPVDDFAELTFALERPQDLELTIFNAQGIKVRSQNVEGRLGENAIQLPMHLSPGIYTLSLQGKDMITSRQFVKR